MNACTHSYTSTAESARTGGAVEAEVTGMSPDASKEESIDMIDACATSEFKKARKRGMLVSACAVIEHAKA